MNLRLIRLIFGVIALFAVGVIGYMIIEGWALLDAIFMTVITLGTVGYGEVHPLSDAGRVFTTLLIVAGVGVIAYSASVLAAYLFEAGFAGSFRRRRMERQLQALENHVIVVGYGRVGRKAAHALLGEDRHAVIVIDDRLEPFEQALEEGFMALQMDATRDEVLHHSGIQRAKGILVCSGSDATNLFVVLSARELNPSLRIVVRCSDQSSENKMIRAGANSVVLPHNIGGVRMANSLLKPKVTEVLDVVSADSSVHFVIEEAMIRDDSSLTGQTVGEADLRRRAGVTLIAIVRSDGDVILEITSDTRITAGDQLIVMGMRDSIRRFEAIAGMA
jgi:voltage-gated potassium channel